MIEHKHVLEAPFLKLGARVARQSLRHLFLVVYCVNVRHLGDTELLGVTFVRLCRHLNGSLHLACLVDSPRVTVDFRCAVGKAEQEVGHVDLDAPTAMHQAVTRVNREQVLGHNSMEEAHVRDADEAVLHFVQTRLRLQVRHLAVEGRVARRRRYFRHDRAHVPVEARALELPLERPTPLQRRHVAGVETRPLRRPVPRGRVEEVLPFVHPQFGDTHQVLLHDLLSVAVERVGERLEGVRHSRTRVGEHLQPTDTVRRGQIRADTARPGQTPSHIGRDGHIPSDTLRYHQIRSYTIR